MFVFVLRVTSLFSDALRCRACVAQPGAGGRFSLNLSHAVSILAYELFQASESALLPEATPLNQAMIQPESHDDSDALLDTGARARLVEDLTAACRALEVLRPAAEAATSAQEAASTAHEARALARAVSGATMSKRGARPLFSLARRVLALAALQQQEHAGVLDAPLLRAAAEELQRAGVDVQRAVPPAHGASAAQRALAKEACDEAVRVLKEAFRARAAGLNLTRAELVRIVHALAAPHS